MVNDAKKHEVEDKEKREKIDVVNQAEHLIYETEKNVNEHDDKLDAAEKDSLTEKVEQLKKAKDSGNIDDIKASMDGLNASWSSVASKMYDTANQDADVPGPESESGTTDKKKKEGEIEDSDFEVVD